MIETVHGIILRTQDQGEFSERVNLYTRQLGKIKAKVEGVKKSISKLRVLILPFTESRLQVYLHGTKRAGMNEPGKVIGGVPLETHSLLRCDWDRMLETTAFTETLDLLTHSIYPNPQEYQLLSDTLNQMETTTNPLLVRLRSTLILLKILGYSLRYHATWNSMHKDQQEKFLELARWNNQDRLFSNEETESLNRVVGHYCSFFLPRPLKTHLFQNKVQAADELTREQQKEKSHSDLTKATIESVLVKKTQDVLQN